MTRAPRALAALAALAACAVPERAAPPDDALAAAEVTEHVGAQLPLELGFTDEAGAPVRLGDVFRRGAPVVLVVDGSSVGASVAAMVHGFATFDPATAAAGVILNRVGSDGHEALLRQAIAPIGVPVLGAL
ncbi:MAG TPA: hypothetical protein VFX29_08665, partial [Longimicrobiaceae bacterium]|nr:hypothetical protein [Longimicrobiaceae bacterium]